MICSVFPAVAMIILTGISVHDIRTRTIPNRCNLCMFVWVFTEHLYTAACTTSGSDCVTSALDSPNHIHPLILPVSLREGFAAALIICLIILVLDFLYLRLRGMPFMGGGDLKLLCITALALGLRLTVIAFAFAVSLAAVSVIVGALMRYIRSALPHNCGTRQKQRSLLHLHSRIPFAPFLTAGFIFAFQAL